jgi:hypothetical protein
MHHRKFRQAVRSRATFISNIACAVSIQATLAERQIVWSIERGQISTSQGA